MRDCNQGWFRQQVNFLRRQFLQDGSLPFSDALSEEIVAKALTAANVRWKDRIYSPLVTLWVFLGQVLSEDHSCRWAVARLIAHRVSRGQRPCSADTGAYCQARKRLPEKFFSEVARRTGRSLDSKVDSRWLWKGRRVLNFDGSSVSMPDTVKNQRAYPQPDTQKPGLGFPLARIAVVFSLSCGAVLDLAICRYAGKGQSELGMLRTLWDWFLPGDVVLTDRLMCTWTEIAILMGRGVDSVTRLHVMRTADFRRGKRLGKRDHIVQWPKPTKPRSIDRKTYNSLPDFITVREIYVKVEQPGFRTKNMIVVTTLLDADNFTKSDLAQLYRSRWNAETNHAHYNERYTFSHGTSGRIVGISALLKLARWRQHWQHSDPGDSSCPTSGMTEFPPAPSHGSSAPSTERALAESASREPEQNGSKSGQDHVASIGSTSCEQGGDQ